VRDRIAPETLYAWKEEINEGNPQANKVSIHHRRTPEVVGAGQKGSARVDRLPGGEYGLWVDSKLDKTHENYKDTTYQISNDFIDSFSIEFTTRDPMTNDYIQGAVVEKESGEGIIRTLLPATQLEGWTLASRPMNPYAIMVKEIKEKIEKDVSQAVQHQGEKEEIKEKAVPQAVDMAKIEIKTNIENKEDKMAEIETKTIPEVPSVTLTGESKERYEKFVASEAVQKKETEMKELASKIKEELKTELSKVEVKEKKMINTPESVETKEMKEYKQMFSKDSKIDINMQFKIAGALADSLGMTKGSLKKDSKSAEAKEFKNFTTNGNLLEFKGLGLTTNQNTDTDYLLSAAELADVFDPVVYNILNQQTVTWNILPKDDFSNKGNNQVQFTLKTAANASAAAYTNNAVNMGNTTRLKYMTKFKKYQVGVEVDGDMIAAARGGPIGDVFAQEVKDSTVDLLSIMNQALFAEVGAETAAGVIGFEYITDQAGNTTLYNLTRSQANGLASTTTTDNYINGSSANLSLINLRAAKRKVLIEGAQLNNLVFVTSYVQGDKFRGIYDALQRLVPTSSRFGFEGRPEFDGIPMFEDKDCNSDDVFLVDLETHRVAIWVPPTLEMLGKDSDSTKGFIKTYWATYNRAPRRMVQIYGNATA
jgi:hypothetical protein